MLSVMSISINVKAPLMHVALHILVKRIICQVGINLIAYLSLSQLSISSEVEQLTNSLWACE